MRLYGVQREECKNAGLKLQHQKIFFCLGNLLMTKVFEDYFTELQADMIDICMEYASDRADMIYIYCSFERGGPLANFFYVINGKALRKNKLDDALSIEEKKSFSYQITDDMQRESIDIIFKDIEKMQVLCKEYNKEMPTEIKIVYDVKKNKMLADYKYDIIYTEEVLFYEPFDKWFDEIKKQYP